MYYIQLSKFFRLMRICLYCITLMYLRLEKLQKKKMKNIGSSLLFIYYSLHLGPQCIIEFDNEYDDYES